MKRLIAILMMVLFIVNVFGQSGPGIQSDKKFRNPKINSDTIVRANGYEINALRGIDGNIKEKFDAFSDSLGSKIDTLDTVDASTLYAPLVGSIKVVVAENTQHAVTGTTALTELYRDTIPANSMGLNGQLEIKTVWTCNNSAGTKTCTVRINGSSIQSNILSTSASAQLLTFLQNRNSLSSQVGYSGGIASPFGGTTVAIATNTLNTAQEMIVVVQGQLQTGTDNMALESIVIKATK